MLNAITVCWVAEDVSKQNPDPTFIKANMLDRIHRQIMDAAYKGGFGTTYIASRDESPFLQDVSTMLVEKYHYNARASTGEILISWARVDIRV